ncbi:MAG: glycosyltransferase family 4 protein [Lachnospiraceae bacterium]|nr:glycosyltransferase family 4 protein [Lachnospiraceae bacterium]
MSKPHILIVSQHFFPESFRINDIAKEWVRRGYRVTVLTGIPNYPQGRFYPEYGLTRKRRETWNGVEILRIPVIPRGHSTPGMVFDSFSFALSGFFWNLTTRLKADLVFSFETSPMTQVRIGCRYSRRHHVPHFLYAQDLWPENVEMVTGIHSPLVIGPIDRMVDRIYRETDRIFVTSPSFVEAVTGRRITVPGEKVHYWPQYAEEFYRPMDREEARTKVSGMAESCAEETQREVLRRLLSDDSFKIVFTGNIGAAQGLEILPGTAEILKRARQDPAHPGIRFVIVGDGRNREHFEGAIREHGVEDCFLLIPRQPADRIPALLACCDAAFLSFADSPLWEKTIPAKLQSYMACAMPILAAAGGETARILLEADCGLASSTGDEAALADAIRRMADMTDDERHALGRNARIYCGEHFDKHRLMDEMDRFFEESLKTCRTGRKQHCAS